MASYIAARNIKLRIIYTKPRGLTAWPRNRRSQHKCACQCTQPYGSFEGRIHIIIVITYRRRDASMSDFHAYVWCWSCFFHGESLVPWIVKLHQERTFGVFMSPLRPFIKLYRAASNCYKLARSWLYLNTSAIASDHPSCEAPASSTYFLPIIALSFPCSHQLRKAQYGRQCQPASN